MRDILHRTLITAGTTEENIYVNDEILYEWMKLLNLEKCGGTKRYIDTVAKEKKRRNDGKITNTYLPNDEQSYVEKWVKEYLTTIESPGTIHSINMGRNGRLVLCNIRNMNTCKNSHEDYYNDSTIYVNVQEKQFSIRCNRIPCRNNGWTWKDMF